MSKKKLQIKRCELTRSRLQLKLGMKLRQFPPSGPEIAKKVSKRVFWGGLEKSLKKTRKSLKIPLSGPFWVLFFGIFRLFRVFFETFLQTPQKTLFETLFCDSGPLGPGDSCKWRVTSLMVVEPWYLLLESMASLLAACQVLSGKWAPTTQPALALRRRAAARSLPTPPSSFLEDRNLLK